jgi:hypothetical protein
MLMEVKPNTAITFNAAGSTLQGKRGLVVGIAPAPIVNTSCNRIGAFTNCTSH